MKIIFLCSSLEPGCDGVGDYTRRLAIELIRIGHQAGIVALNDQYLTDEFNGMQGSGGIVLPVLRLPSHWASARRFKQAAWWIDDFNAEWLSLQFVPFSFHPKGLPFGLGNLLGVIARGRYLHIMVHELWVGMDKEAPMKFIFWGWLQRQLIKSLFTKLKPTVIHTQSSLYIKMLEKIGFKPQLLPLFGNITLAPNKANNDDWRINGNEYHKTISFVIFGGIHKGAPVGRLANELKQYGKDKQVNMVLKIVGRCGSEKLRWEEEWKAEGLMVELLGEQSPQRISEILSNASFGISTTPASLVEKSGSVAAMREHGLNVLCVSRAWRPRGFAEPALPPGITQYREGQIENFFAGCLAPFQANDISAITRQFVNNLLLSV